jgi:hypothetical protein
VEHTQPVVFSADETTDLGRDIDEAAEDLDHMISPEELLRAAMGRQEPTEPARFEAPRAERDLGTTPPTT